MPEVCLTSLWNLSHSKGRRVAEDHLGIGYLAGYLERRGMEVAMFSPGYATIDEVIGQLQPFDFRLLGVSFYASNLADVKRLIRAARKANPHLHITLGGPAATFWALELLNESDPPDSVVIGEGELTLAELAERVLSGEAYGDVMGLALPGPPPVLTRPRPLIADLDVLPLPRRSPPPSVSRWARIEHGRGCFANCSFCNVRAFTGLQPGATMRLRSIGSVLNETALVQRTHPTVEVFEIVDSNFVLPGPRGRQRLMAWADEIERRGLRFRFAINCRAPEVHREVFERLTQVGLFKVYLGVETMVPGGLERFNKHVTVQQNYEAIKILTELGIVCRLGLILIDPLVTIEDLITNLTFVAQTPAHVELHMLLKGLRADKGSPISDRLLAEGLITDYYPRGQMRFRDPALLRFFDLVRRCGVAPWLAFLAPASQAVGDDVKPYTEMRGPIVQTLIRLAELSRSDASVDSPECQMISEALRRDLLEPARRFTRQVARWGGT